ncbi:hypothetical protein NSB31_29755, partial [Bacillus cereus]|nr:hypothetical protein [Bacillus cereus]
VGMGSIILNGAKIGKNTIIGAGSLVPQGKEYEDGVLILGSPAKVIRKLTEDEIENIKKSSRIITYEISERVGSSYNYWLSMGSPDRLNKEEKEILHKASFPKIEFKYSKKNVILNIITELRGYAAKLILIKSIK